MSAPTPGGSVQLPADTTVEDVMAALAHQSIFDLPTLAKEMVAAAQANTGDDDARQVNILVSADYVLLSAGSFS